MSYTRFGCTSRILAALAGEPMTRAELSWRLQIPGDQVSNSLSNLKIYKKIRVCGHRPSRFGDARMRTVLVFALAVPVTIVIEDEIKDPAPRSPKSDAGSGRIAPAAYRTGLRGWGGWGNWT